MGDYASPWPVIRGASHAFVPPRKVSVAEGVERTLVLRQPGGYSGPWSASETPYMVEPMNMLASRQHEAVCFVGPARSGKTLGLLDGWLAHAVVNDPGDMLITQMTQEKAREYSKIRVDRAIRHSPEIHRLISTRGHDDNTHDKLTRHGMWIKIGWPSATQLASSDYRYVALTDYDRMPDNVDGEGAPFGLGVKRTQTYLSRGMCMVESSPGREYVDPHWQPGTPHEGPPASGIIGIYNRGDRRRWYWQCPDCSEYFEAAPGLSLFATLPPEEELLESVRSLDLKRMARQHAFVCCPHCGSQIEAKWKHHLNDIRTARWVMDGMSVTRDGEMVGEAVESSIASYWLGGVAAAYQNWESIILRYLQGLREYALSGSDLTLRTTTNTDQAEPYLPRSLRGEAGQAELAELSEDFPQFIVPTDQGARFVTVAVDVQGGQDSRFVIQAHAHAPEHEQWVIDRRDIRDSKRPGSRSSGCAQIDPARYPEDWEVLTDLLSSTYRTPVDGEELRVAEIIVDTGGEDGVTANAYAWWLSLPNALRSRAWLYKGASSSSSAPVKESKASDKSAGRSRTVWFLLCNPNPLKDAVLNGAYREDSGPGKIHLGSWLRADFWDEMRAEVKQANGKYQKVRKRNEALDLCAMTRALLDHMLTRKRNRLDWDRPPAWARELHSNALREAAESRRSRNAERDSQNEPESPRRADPFSPIPFSET
ncbi:MULTISPECIES: terminase gpA endonuclease subunit [unclassified Thioalkalivibrio]|uniref:terminase gpA endonuclease subunit n=1 Tax=unclassified Thioalkalivibrio TaxID=2621013 RepID=UPI00037AD5CC|nr:MULTISPECIES: terminase gpA endonuclease subunit [unclassified Thioalkalivibrio]